VTARESLTGLREGEDAARPLQTQLHEVLQRQLALEQHYEALQKGYSRLLEDHVLLQRQVTMPLTRAGAPSGVSSVSDPASVDPNSPASPRRQWQCEISVNSAR